MGTTGLTVTHPADLTNFYRQTCLSPIAGIDKAFLRQWLKWMEVVGPLGLSPLPVLAIVNNQQATAELRPSHQHQTDEDDLKLYDVLDTFERFAIDDKMTPVKVYQHLHLQFPDSSLIG